MTDAQVRDEAVTIFLAGHETTANALTWTWYLLSQNPDVEAKLHGELDAVLSGRCARRRGSSEARVHGDGARGVDAPLPAGLDHRPAGALRLRGWRLRRAEALDRGREPVGDAPRPAVLPGSGAFRSRALSAGGRRPRGRSSPISRSEAARGCASGRASPGWRVSCFSRRWPGAGACASSPGRSSRRRPPSRSARSTACG